jgi:hypothetical protein
MLLKKNKKNTKIIVKSTPGDLPWTVVLSFDRVSSFLHALACGGEFHADRGSCF